jgi:LysM repeat protein
MSQSLVFTLLLSALVLPVLGAVVLRLLSPRVTLAQLYGTAALIFVVAGGSVVALALSDIPSLQIGNLSILLPITAPDDRDLAEALPPNAQIPQQNSQQPTSAISTTAALPATSQATLAETETLSATATSVPTATIAPATTAPTEAPTEAPTATPEPTVVPPTPVPPTSAPAAERRKYTVQPGDTLLSIAKKFDTTVQALIDANKLTSKQADALRIGQELVIP